MTLLQHTKQTDFIDKIPIVSSEAKQFPELAVIDEFPSSLPRFAITIEQDSNTVVAFLLI